MRAAEQAAVLVIGTCGCCDIAAETELMLQSDCCVSA